MEQDAEREHVLDVLSTWWKELESLQKDHVVKLNKEVSYLLSESSCQSMASIFPNRFPVEEKSYHDHVAVERVPVSGQIDQAQVDIDILADAYGTREEEASSIVSMVAHRRNGVSIISGGEAHSPQGSRSTNFKDGHSVFSWGKTAVLRKNMQSYEDMKAVIAKAQTQKAQLDSVLHHSTAIGLSAVSWRIVNGSVFGLLCATLIVVNTIYIGVQTEIRVKHLYHSPNAIDDPMDWIAGDIVFVVLYSIELILRLSAGPRLFVTGPDKMWNLFDFIIVFSSLVDMSLLVFGSSFDLDFAVFKMMRLARIVRILRFARNVPFVRHLRTMLFAIGSLLSSFLPAVGMLISIIYMFALIFMQGASSYISKHRNDGIPVTSEDMEKYFGNVETSMYSLLAAVSGGYDWVEVSTPIIEIGPVYVTFFVMYIVFVHFGLLNILTGIFVNAAVQSSQLNRELQADQATVRRDAMTKEIVGLLITSGEMHLEGEHGSLLSWDAFQASMEDDQVKSYFMMLDLDVASAQKIFKIIDSDRTGYVELIDFVQGCLSMRGTAKMVDIAMLQVENEKLLMAIRHLRRALPNNGRHTVITRHASTVTEKSLHVTHESSQESQDSPIQRFALHEGEFNLFNRLK